MGSVQDMIDGFNSAMLGVAEWFLSLPWWIGLIVFFIVAVKYLAHVRKGEEAKKP